MIVDLEATDRWQAIEELVNNLVATGKIKPENRDVIVAAIKKREQSMSTGIGFGLGLPHATTDLVPEAVSVLGRSKTGVNFDALDHQPVKLVLLFLVPKGQIQKHLHTLANIAKLLHKADFRQALEQVQDVAALNEIIENSLGRAKSPVALLPHKQIELRLQTAVREILSDADPASILVRPCLDPKFGDYQSNALMSLAKARKMNPRQLASDVVARLDVSEFCEKVEIAGAGFLNFRLKISALAHSLDSAARGEHLFFAKADKPKTVIIDFSSPNVAKPMHVGHIRSTILGDSLARTLRLLGQRVITDNHIGDWGTQFGMLLVGWKAHLDRAALGRDPIAEMERLYKKVSAACVADETVREQAKQELVKLQGGDEENLKIWREMIALSERQFDEIYARLGVKFDHTLGESFYNPRLKPLVEELFAKKIARESEGAIAIFFDDNPHLKKHPALIRKSDGGFNYTTTDLATLEYRLKTWQPDEIVYVTDGRQQLHFQQIFAAFRKWRCQLPAPSSQLPKLAHVWFGSILGEDGKPFKTRSGETVKLADLLHEAEERAFIVVKTKQLERPEEERVPEALWPEIARVVAIGAVKYADLLPNRQSDYLFSWDKMLALNGNTAPYLQYAFARIRSIFRKGNVGQASSLSPSEKKLETGKMPVLLTASEEIALAKHLLNFGLTLEAVSEEFRPNFLCNYLYELAGKFTAFYENCPVLKAGDASRASRLALCDLTAQVLKLGLESLGIEVVEQM
ncbi:MAG TPA: arginine--tRNA ligase [Verrucomicrobiae bacterium]|nr:arginine--tRNA ligase [Verrucomicrobiae bacterium]